MSRKSISKNTNARDRFKPVRLDIEAALAKAKKNPEFVKAWDSLEEEYAALDALMTARNNRS